MDTLSIHTFVAVTESRSFSKAADVLYLTQPAVSKRIAALEEILGFRLFDRIGKKIILTEAGKELYPRAKRILLELEDSRRAINNLSGNVTGRLSFGTSHHIGLHRLPPILSAYSKVYPQVELDIQFLGSETACDAVEHGNLEMALITMPNIQKSNLLQTHIWDDPLQVVIGKGHPLAAETKHSKAPLTPLTLAGHPAILPGSGTFTRDIIDSDFLKQGVSLTVKISTNYLETIKMLVTVGLGWSILPESMINAEELISLDVEGIRPRRSLGVIRHSARTLSNAGRAMIDMLGEEGV
ncbi:MAG: LysR family transcriptional regulator [Proteobacteria bacterium]|nr:LysR family transcriptional regulator [Pseudomonadota bacterium]MBU1709606.1 LysR family transcriptional regulator [Pseudomonadota bacterium]